MTNDNPPSLLTPGLLAKSLQVPIHRIIYLLRTRAHIQPAAKAGRLRLYPRRALAHLRHELNALDARRGNRCRGDASHSRSLLSIIHQLISAHQRGDAAAEAHAFAQLREAGFPLQWANEMKGETSRG